MSEETLKYIHPNTKHGGKGTRLYNIWALIKQRCTNPNNKDYYNYGGRGITVCNDWLGFVPFMYWSLSNGYSENLVIDRINNNKNYEPSNCRWITILESNRNKRNIPMTMSLANEIRELHNTGKYTQRYLAKKYSLNYQYISKLIRNERWFDYEK